MRNGGVPVAVTESLISSCENGYPDRRHVGYSVYHSRLCLFLLYVLETVLDDDAFVVLVDTLSREVVDGVMGVGRCIVNVNV